MVGEILFSIIVGVAIYFLLQLYKTRKYFIEKNVKHIQPNLFFGNTSDVVFGRKHTWECLDEVYRAFPEEELVGFFTAFQPAYVPRSRELLERIFVKDFSYFHDRTAFSGEIKSPLEANLFVLTGNIWKAVRNQFIPIFTAGKLKYMYKTISDCGEGMIKFLDGKCGTEVEMTDAMYIFAMEIIGSTAFGIIPNSKFLDNGKRLFDNSLATNIKTMIRQAFPKFSKVFGIIGFSNDDVNKYFCEIVANTLKHRLESDTERNDFIQLLTQLKQKGKVELSVVDKSDDYLMSDNFKDTVDIKLTDDILVGGAFTFLLAGFHSSAMTLAYALYELSLRPDIVEKIRQELKENIQGDVPTYDELKKMVYLDKVIKETLRLHPTAPVLTRVCTKKFETSSGHTIMPDDMIFIPVQSLHMDPSYWPEPEVFNPDRFDTEPMPGTYFAFGDGPRICIGMRFVMLEMKYSLSKLLKRYEFKLSKKTELPLKMFPRSFLATPTPIFFEVTKA